MQSHFGSSKAEMKHEKLLKKYAEADKYEGVLRKPNTGFYVYGEKKEFDINPIYIDALVIQLIQAQILSKKTIESLFINGKLHDPLKNET